MKTKKLIPRNAAPVKRENVATVSTDGNAIAPHYTPNWNPPPTPPPPTPWNRPNPPWVAR